MSLRSILVARGFISTTVVSLRSILVARGFISTTVVF